MKIWKISIALLLFSSRAVECTALNKTPATAKTVQLPTASAQAISNAQQEILSLKQQLKALENKNNELKILMQSKQSVKNRIKTENQILQEKQAKNKPIFERYQKAFDNNELNPKLVQQIKNLQQETKSAHTELEKLYTNLWGLKTKSKRIAPNRTKLLRQLHDAQKLLKELQLAAEITKLKK